MAVEIKNYEELKDALIRVIEYLDSETPLEENLCYSKDDIKDYLREVVSDAIKEYYSKK